MIDALVLAGDKEGYIPVSTRNKAFLLIDNKTIIERVIEELVKSNLVENIFVTGPKEALTFLAESMLHKKAITIIEQQDSIVRNIANAYKQMYPDGSNRPVLILPSDIPITVSFEIDEFISKSNYSNYDYVMGFVKSAALEPFYPRQGIEGIRLSYFYFKQFVGRQNNLHIARPLSVKNMQYIDSIYSLRYQKKLVNYLRFLMILQKSSVRKFPIVRISLMLQLALLCDKIGMYNIAKLVGRNIDLKDFEDCISEALAIRFKIHCQDRGASAIDIDNVRDFDIIRKKYSVWMKTIQDIFSTKGNSYESH